jgi:hypothetical protein
MIKWVYALFVVSIYLSHLEGRVKNRNNDFEIWISEIVHKELAEKVDGEFIAEERWRDAASELYFWFWQFSVFLKFNKWIHIGPGYRQMRIADPLHRGNFNTIYNPLLSFTTHMEKDKWKFLDRNRFEILSFSRRKDIYVYRNRFTVITPWELTQARFNPQIEEEFFWIESRGIEQNRFSVGAKINFSENVSGIIYYMLRHLKLANDDWIKQNVLGFRLKCKY